MNNIISEIKKSNNIVLLCHENPDGDAIGSSLAMYHLLKKIGKAVDIVIENPPQKFNFIAGYQEIKRSSSKNYDLAISLDTPAIERINNPDRIVERASKLMVIDHHASNLAYGNINYVEDSSSCCEVVYHLIEKMQIPIDEELATSLCVGMLTDTGGLSFSNTKTSTYEMASDLSKIVNIPKIHKKVLGTITKNQFELKKIGLQNLEFYKNNQIALTYISEADLKKLNLPRNEADILANLGRDIESVEVSIYIRLYNDGNRVSLRSNNINVSKVAQIFGGGGHINAAGLTSTMDFNKLKEKLIEELSKKIDEWNISSKQA